MPAQSKEIKVKINLRNKLQVEKKQETRAMLPEAFFELNRDLKSAARSAVVEVETGEMSSNEQGSQHAGTTETFPQTVNISFAAAEAQ